MSAVWLFENILTHKDSHLDSVDPYLPYLDEEFHLNTDEMIRVEKRFYENTEKYRNKITTHKMLSFDYLKQRTEPADLIYVDGDHTSKGCLIDGVLAHMVLKRGGIIIFDDYLWTGLIQAPNVPKASIDAFMTCFAEEYTLLQIGYQVILKKK